MGVTENKINAVVMHCVRFLNERLMPICHTTSGQQVSQFDLANFKKVRKDLFYLQNYTNKSYYDLDTVGHCNVYSTKIFPCSLAISNCLFR